VRWLIDGYNVIRRDADLRGAEEQGLEAGRRALLRLVIEASHRCQDSFTIVFDGAPATSADSGKTAARIDVVFARPPENADGVLVRLASRFREEAVVVTSDRAVRQAAGRAHAVTVTADAFVAAVRAGRGAGAIGEDAADDEDDDPPPKRGNPHRSSREERAAARVLNRLARRDVSDR
jgi:predicted RNA-binding protein with PIN domain